MANQLHFDRQRDQAHPPLSRQYLHAPLYPQRQTSAVGKRHTVLFGLRIKRCCGFRQDFIKRNYGNGEPLNEVGG
jgi:hypothetical protein